MPPRNKLMPNYGWVQNTSNLSTVRDTIELVPPYGITHSDLMQAIKDFRIRNNSLPSRWNWDARCRIKAIHALGLVSLDRNIQGYVLTDLGLKLVRCPKSDEIFRNRRLLSPEEIDVFKQGLLTNPPVMRVLELLHNELNTTNVGMTKYDIGSQLGFVGDRGFTHLDPEWIAANGYSFNDKEGDADKWARTILSWLSQVGWVFKSESKQKIFDRTLALYKLNPEVSRVIRYEGRRIIKNVPSEMLCSEHHSFPKLVQKRRIILLCFLSSPVTLNNLVQHLGEKGIEADEEIVRFEIINLKQAGFNIVFDGGYYKLTYRIHLDVAPDLFESPNEDETPIESLIERLVVEYEATIPSRLVDNIIRYGYDGAKNNEFESTLYEFFRFVGYSSTLLGQGHGRVADVIIRYIDSTYARSYGVIIDAKATSTRYSFPVGDVRKMKEYIDVHGPELLGELIPRHAFAFISSEFIDNVTQPLEEINRDKSIGGTAIRVLNLLELADHTVQGRIRISELFDSYTTNNLFQIN